MMFALLHMIGTVVALFLIIFVSGEWDGKRSRERLRRVLERAAIEMELNKNDCRDGKHNAQISHHLSERYSTDRVVNRLSDAFSLILIAIEVISLLAQFGFIVFVAWLTFADDLEHAKIAWLAVPVSLLFLVFNQLLVGACYLSTGRMPGEAKGARNIASNLVK